MKKLIYVFCIAALLVGCKSAKYATVTPPKKVEVPSMPDFLSSKVELTVPSHDNTITIGGLMKMKSHECVQVSLLMPILRTEIVRIEVIPEQILIVDRMNKRYVRATKDEVKELVSKNVEFSELERLLFDASLPGGKSELTAKELGFSSLGKAKVKLYDFSTREVQITPIDVSSRYTQVTLEELMNMLTEHL